MALRLTDGDSWTNFFTSIGIPDTNAETYATEFVGNQLTETELQQLDKNTLKKDLKVSVLGHQLKILQHIKTISAQEPTSAKNNLPSKLPEFSAQMSNSDFRTAMSDWTTFKNIQPSAISHVTDLLFSACNQLVRKIIDNTCPEFRLSLGKDLISKIRSIVTFHSHPLTHRTKFRLTSKQQ